MIAQLSTTTALTGSNINDHLLYEVTEDNFYMASLWVCYAGNAGTQPAQTEFSILIIPPGETVPTTTDAMRTKALAWTQQIYIHENFNIAGMALPKGTKIFVGANTQYVTFTMTGTGM